MIRTLLLFTLLPAISLRAADTSPASRERSPDFAGFGGDTLYLVAGTTNSYTVDTPQGEGAVYTGPDAGERVRIGDKNYHVVVQRGALSPTLKVSRREMAVGSAGTIVLDFVAGQRSPRATVRIHIPRGIVATLDNTSVDAIGRGEVALRDLPRQSIGRHGTDYSYDKVGEASISDSDAGQTLTFTGIDLRPLNGIDLRIKINIPGLPAVGKYVFTAEYSTTEPEVYHSRITPLSTAVVEAVNRVADLRREMPVMFTLSETPELYLKPTLRWTAPADAKKAVLLCSMDGGANWSVNREVKPGESAITAQGLKADTDYLFKLSVQGGSLAGESNVVEHRTGRIDITSLGVKGDGTTDDTDAMNAAILALYNKGGGVLTFPAGDYLVRTVQLKSNVWLHVDKGAVIRCIGNTDEPEPTWFSDRAYRSGLSPTDPKPYSEPENWLTKQDVGHTFFRNTMFFAERERNIKIFGTGTITGDGKLATSDRVMNNPAGSRADKMFTFKLCTQIEIGGYDNGKDMWYDPEKDEPYYMEKDGGKNFDLDNVLWIDKGGHFVLLATGTDTLNVHDTYLGRDRGNARDIYDFMACNVVGAKNIYSKMSSDDIIKLGSDCSLGFTRPVSNYMVRNIIGDTNCNLFQIGSETADDIRDVWVDNIYVLGSNKAGFSISTNDGGHVKNIYLNSGKTGSIHSRSQMRRTRAPFFISISNRGRVIGADVKRFRFNEDGNVRDELLVTNSPIGSVENVVICDIDISEVYGGSSHGGTRWKPYDGSQNEATPIIAGYALPRDEDVEGGLGFTMPDGRNTGYISGIEFHGVNLTVKGGHPADDAAASPPEIGVGRYNVGDLKIQPAYGFWFRHAENVVVSDCTISCEKPDGRHAIVLDDVQGALIEGVKMPEHGARPLIEQIDSNDVKIEP